MASRNLFERLYLILARRRALLFAVTILLLAVCCLLFARVTLEEDIGAMLPDDRSDAARDFALLQRSPFARKVVLSLRAGPSVDTGNLMAAADRLAADLGPPLFSRAVSGPGNGPGFALPQALLELLPGLVTAEDMAPLAAAVEPGAVHDRLRESFARLLSPEGWGSQELLSRDPLGLRFLALGKARSLNLIPRMRLVDGHFMSADGRSALVAADTPVSLTDYRGARKLEERIRQARQSLPPGIELDAVSGHFYTLANSRAITRDLTVILTLSSLAILAIYVGFLRSWWAFFVFLVPASVLVFAAGGLALLAPAVFAVTVGFGGVLLGMADEYAMHVYFALGRNPATPARTVGEVARPVIFGGLATGAAFGVMLTSHLPGQRQLGVFSLIGIAASILVSLVVLPQLVTLRRRPAPPPAGFPWAPRVAPRWILGPWILLLLLCAWQASRVRFNGDLGAMNLAPPELRAAETRVRETWGDLRGTAVIYAAGDTLDEALERAGRVHDLLAGKLPPDQVVSLAPLLPPAAVQEANRRRWVGFWKEHAARLGGLLEAEERLLGFTPGAFAPFLDSLDRPAPPAGPEALRRAGLGEVLDALIQQDRDGWRVLTLVPDTAAARAIFPAGPGAPPGIRLVSQARFRETVSRALQGEFTRYLLFTSLLVLAIVTAVFRDWRKILLSLVPVVTGLLFMFGVMGATGLSFNLFNIVATVLIIGLCIDYGIFMVVHLTEGTDHASGRAVLVSGLTTIAGFGILVLARHPALHSIGLTVMLGFGAAIPAALLVIPALLGNRR